MKQLATFIRKEFAHMLRDRKTLLILFGLPLVQMIIFGYALTNEVKNSKVIIMDHAKDIASRQIISKISASRYFDIEQAILSPGQIESSFRKGVIKMVIVFPSGFNGSLKHLNTGRVQIIADASDPNTASTLTHYLSAIITDYQHDLPANK